MSENFDRILNKLSLPTGKLKVIKHQLRRVCLGITDDAVSVAGKLKRSTQSFTRLTQPSGYLFHDFTTYVRTSSLLGKRKWHSHVFVKKRGLTLDAKVRRSVKEKVETER